MAKLNNTSQNQFNEKQFQTLINDCHRALLNFSNGFIGEWSKDETLEQKISSIDIWMIFFKDDVEKLMSIISEQIEILKPSK